MLTEPQKLWVDALRSGEYRQGRHVLHAGIRYCCLGVACELYIKHVDPDFPREDDGECVTYGARCTQELPSEVKNWLQLASPAGGYADGAEYSLVVKNDKGATFGEIADLIESEPEGLFVSSVEGNYVD